jgi:formate-dependent nitrite reductase membrane component NrfD
MYISPILKIFASWFFGGLIVGGGFLYIFKPLAGLTVLTLIVMGVTMLIIPIVHIVMVKSQEPKEKNSSSVAVAILIGVIFLIIFALGATGRFNFA